MIKISIQDSRARVDQANRCVGSKVVCESDSISIFVTYIRIRDPNRILFIPLALDISENLEDFFI